MEYEWGIDGVKASYHWLNLTGEQVQKIYHFEQSLHDFPIGHSLSSWEEDDYILDVFESILDKKQFKSFLKWQSDSIKSRITHYKNTDKEQQQYIILQQKLNEWFTKKLSSKAFHKEFHIYRYLIGEQQSKIDYLKSEYQICLRTKKSRIIKNHYQEYKRFAPIRLELELLKCTVDEIIPQYDLFSFYTEPETLAIGEMLIKKFGFIYEHHQHYFTRLDKDWAIFEKQTKKKYVKEVKGGFKYTIQTSEEEIFKQKVFSILLSYA